MPSLSLGQESVAAAIHLAGFLLVCRSGLLLRRRALGPAVSPAQRRVVTQFSAAWLAMFGASMLFHLAPVGRLRETLSSFDNGAIFIAIAAGWACFAPFKLAARAAAWMIGIVWGLAAIGLSGEAAAAIAGGRTGFQDIAWLIYLGQALLPLALFGRIIFGRLSGASLGYLFGSLACFGAGMLFYRQPALPWSHAVWHAAIVAGCLLNHGGLAQLLREREAAPAAG